MAGKCMILFIAGKEMHLARKNFWILTLLLILFHGFLAAGIFALMRRSYGFCPKTNIHIVRIIETCDECPRQVNNLKSCPSMNLSDIQKKHNEFLLQSTRDRRNNVIDLSPYSAYYDDRKGPSGLPDIAVQILAMCRQRHLIMLNKLKCLLWFGNYSHPELQSAQYNVIWDSPAEFQAILITCKLPNDVTNVNHVSLTDSCHLPSNVIEVKQSYFANRSTENIGLCNKVMYSAPDAIRLVEWLELNTLLGVNKFYIYNTTVNGRSNDVIQLYSKRGTIALRQHDYLDKVSRSIQGFPFPSPDYTQNWQLEVISLTDCIYSAKERYLVVIDLDEILYPISGNFKQLLKENGFQIHNKSAALTFFTTIFSDEFGPDLASNASWYLHTMRYRKRTRLDWESPKSIIDSHRCKGVGQHVCLKPLDGYTYRSNLEPKIGYVRHYRTTCRLTGEPGKCAKLMKRHFLDNALDSLNEDLSVAVSEKLKLLDLL